MQLLLLLLLLARQNYIYIYRYVYGLPVLCDTLCIHKYIRTTLYSVYYSILRRLAYYFYLG